MRSLRAKHFILIVTAMFSLFVSAVSACACSHHEPVKAAAESCHSSSHEAPAAEQFSGSNYFESDCNCSERTPVPAIVAKKDDKRAAVEKQIAETVELQTVFAIEFAAADAAVAAFEPPQSTYQ
ncbi:MAG TPA: hypothetical protein PLK77_13340, partial [Pyrinomonadaceae bacterium]|nr:hypothetical protein [Pyrinomonadaceae bacterium]